jgi:hypothetical protein
MAEEEQVETQETPPPAAEEVERSARAMGWQPKEQWKGNPEVWVDAPTFIRRGEEFGPHLQHDRRRLQESLAQRDARLAQVEAELKKTNESLQALTAFNEEMTEDRKERRKAELGAALRAAREAGDDVKVAELQNELGEVVKPAAKPAAAAPPPKPNGAAQPTIQPWVRTFIDGRKDFFEDADKIALFNSRMMKRRQAGDTRVGEVEGVDLLNEVVDEVEKTLGGNSRRRAAAPTEESRPTGGGGRGSGGGKSYQDLPAEAQKKCDAQEAKFVGKPGFKDQAAWRRHYVKEYFGTSARSFE